MSHRRRRLAVALAPALLSVIVVVDATAQSPAVVHVDLMDPSTGPSVKSMRIKVDPESVKAGAVSSRCRTIR
jgi:hypothetical protein